MAAPGGPSVAELLQVAAARLDGSSTTPYSTPQLDAELLLAAATGKDRTWLKTWPEHIVAPEVLAPFEQTLARRERGEPMAHILGHRGFWTLDLKVTSATLIPRPDTELLVETGLALAPASTMMVLDLGTGTGAVALALASERLDWAVTAVDLSPEALAVAQANRDSYRLKNVQFLQSDWFSALSGQHFGLIVSNPPYIAEQDQHLNEGDVRFEPRLALTSGPDGLDAIRHIVYKAPEHLATPGWLAFEHGFDQAAACRVLLQERGFVDVASRHDLGGQERVTLGRWPC